MSDMNESTTNQSASDEITINFAEIWNAILKYKLTILFVTIIFTSLGALFSLTLDSKYESDVKLLPEIDSKMGGSGSSLGGLSSLAGLAGINLSGAMAGSDAIQPAMYPEIVQSIPFLQELSQSTVYNIKQKKFQKLADYLKQDNSNAPIQLLKGDKNKETSDMENINLPKGVLSPELINISKQESAILKELKESIVVEIDKKKQPNQHYRHKSRPGYIGEFGKFGIKPTQKIHHSLPHGKGKKGIKLLDRATSGSQKAL